MMSSSLHDISPDDVSGHGERPEMILTVYDILSASELAVYGVLPDEFEPMEAFVARTPHCALRWICQRVSRPRLIQAIEEIYHHPAFTAINAPLVGLAANVVHEALEDRALSSETRQPTSASGVKRKRGVTTRTTRDTNKAMVEKLNIALVQTVANSQDWEHARAPDGATVEEQRYRNFARRLPGVGVNAVTQMITKAVAVGTMEVFRDWQAIVQVWKRQNFYGKKLFQQVALSRVDISSTVEESAHANDALVQCSSAVGIRVSRLASPDEAGLTLQQTESFRYKFFDAKKTQVDGIAEDMRHRWKMDALYEEYELLEQEIRRKSQGTGMRGRGYNTVAKEHLFALVYSMDLGRRPTKADDFGLWSDFSQFLDWGKRWNMIKRRFGSVGIFGLLPRSSIPNAFVERSLTQVRVSQWIEMIAECNQDVVIMANKIEPLFRACMEESQPPSEFLFLEHLERYKDTRPLALFEWYAILILFLLLWLICKAAIIALEKLH